MKTFLSSRRLLSATVLALGAVYTFSSPAFAGSEFDQKTPDFDAVQAPVQMNEIESAKAVLATMRVQCDSDQHCWLAGTMCTGTTYQMSINAGVGNQSYNSGTGPVFNLGGSDYNSHNREPSYGASAGIKHSTQKTDLFVGPALKRLFETYQYSPINPDGSTKKTLSPAEQVMMSFFATVFGKLETCRTNNQ